MILTRRTILTASAVAGAAAAFPFTPAAAKAPLGGKAGPGFHRFKVGSFEVIALHDGVVQFPMPKGFVKNASDEEVAKAYGEQGLPMDKLTITFTALAVNTGDRVVLIDTGFGNNGGPTTGTVAANLAAAGIEAKDVDTVLISHFHGDHIGGIRAKDGTAVFPNAEIVVPEAEWAFWTDEARRNSAPEAMKGSFAAVERVFGPIAKDVRRIAWGKEAVPGITAMQADGHTPGHTAFVIGTGADRMVYVADITNHPGVFARRPDWQIMFDMDPQQAIATRKKLLDMAAAEKVRLSFYHGPFPSTGFILREGAGYSFTPAMWS
jgi:glyoxylase-like metal-dependent hydrolase (beta-lactamase superfamily II)